LDFAASATNPCGLLDAAQLQTLGMQGVAGEDKTSGLGAACAFDDVEGASGQRVDLTFVAGNGGLDHLYKSKSTFWLFEPQPLLQGYPTVLISANDSRDRGTCGLAVGLTDTNHLLVNIQMRTGSKPAPRLAESCIVAKEAADQALTSIKAGTH
jgi:hypothetical protein